MPAATEPASTESESTRHGPVTSELCVRLATLLNDFNPAHYDHTFATSVGLPGVIGPGTLLQGWVAADVAARLDRLGRRATARLGVLDLRFTAPVFLDDHIAITYAWAGDEATLEITASRLPAAASAAEPTASAADGPHTDAARTVATGTVRLADRARR